MDFSRESPLEWIFLSYNVSCLCSVTLMCYNVSMAGGGLCSGELVGIKTAI